MEWRYLFVILGLLQWRSTFTSADTNKGKSKTVSTLLNAKWASSPIALEISEILNEEDSSYFWMFLESLNQNAERLSSSSKWAFTLFIIIYLFSNNHLTWF